VTIRAMEKPDAGAAQKDRRLRAVYRRELQDSVRFSAVVVAIGIAVSAASGCLVAPSTAVAEIAIATPLVFASVAIAWTVPARGRRYVIQLGMLVGLLPFLSTAFAAVRVPESEPVSLGAVGVVAIAFAVFMPLERKPHFVWLIIANATFFGVLLGVLAAERGAATWSSDMPALACTAAVAFGLSMGANEIQLRRRAKMNRQLLAVRGLYSRMKEHELDLRRQDEFLVMQQETLVVQQASCYGSTRSSRR
jgi:hypothetical protein